MSKPQPPAPPNPTAVAQAQTGTNLSTAIGQQTLNNTNQVTPFGSSNYAQTGGYTDPTTGQFVPSYTQTTTLNPAMQGIANTLVGTGEDLAGNIKPVDVSGNLNNTIMGGPQALDPTIAAAAYNAETGFLNPAFQQQNMDLQDKLTAQGIPLGSQAYGNATNQLQNTQNNARTVAANNAVVTGANQANNMYGLAVQGQQQNIAQQQLPQTQLSNLLATV